MDKKKNRTALLSNKTICILYSLCAICWIASGIFDLKKTPKGLIGYIDLGFGAVWIFFAIVYYKKIKKDK